MSDDTSRSGNAIAETLNKASSAYGGLYAIRAAIQAVPVIGGPLDTLFTGPGQNWQQKRQLEMLEDIKNRLSDLPTGLASQEEFTERIADLLVEVLERGKKTSSQEKRKRFAIIFANHVRKVELEGSADWAVRMLDDLGDLDFVVLSTIAQVPVQSNNLLAGLRIVRTRDSRGGSKPPDVTSIYAIFPNQDPNVLFGICASLTGLGLLRDEGIGRIGVGGMELLTPTPLAYKFLKWLEDEDV
jgi:hypothetical protein